MPRIETKRNKYWGTESLIQRDYSHCRTLDREKRSESWRRNRNRRKALRTGKEPRKELAGASVHITDEAGVVTDADGRVIKWLDQSGNKRHLVSASSRTSPRIYPARSLRR